MLPKVKTPEKSPKKPIFFIKVCPGLYLPPNHIIKERQ